MTQRKDSRSFLLWLGLTVTLLTVALAITAALSLRQSASVEAAARLQADSVTSLAFQTEREFMRLRTALQVALLEGEGADWQAVQTRFDLFASRVQLLHDNPSTAELSQRREYLEAFPRLQQLAQQLDPLLRAPATTRAELGEALTDMMDLGPYVQALSFAANSLVSHRVDKQVAVVRKQHQMIGALVLVQLAVLLLATGGLINRHRRLLREQRLLEQLNRELVQAKNAAEDASRAKGQFLANMSHELRTPFNGMLGMIDMLQDSELSPAQQDQLHTARSSAQHLLALLNDILDLSALDAGKIRIQAEPVHLPQLVRDVCHTLRPEALRAGLTLEWLHDELPCAWVLADPTRLRQILFNLIGNAIKFTPQGQVRVHLSGSRPDEAQVRWSITVNDTGIGMDAPTLAGLFQRFYQADARTNRRYGGTGLGLEISRTLARLMGGDIWASSQAGQGSSFTAEFITPVCPAAAAPLPVTAPTEAVTAPKADLLPEPDAPPCCPWPPTHAPGWQVLVAEDHPVNRKFVGLILEKMGHQVTFAHNGLQALQAVEQQHFDIVLMDLHMPEMDGLEATRRIRLLPGPRGHIPIVALTADVMNETQQRARAVGMNAYLAKPVQKQQLMDMMALCLTPPACAPAPLPHPAHGTRQP